MVRVYGANISDVTDREQRALGYTCGKRMSTGAIHPIRLAHGYGAVVSPRTWWMHHAGHYPLLVDDFEGTLKWKTGAGTVALASDTGYVLEGAKALKLTTGATAGNQAMAFFETGQVRTDTTYYALELWFALNCANASGPRDFEVWWTINDNQSNIRYDFGWRYLFYNSGVAQKKLQYYNSSGAWTNGSLATIDILVTTAQWHYFLAMLQRDADGHIRYRYACMDGNVMYLLTPGTSGYESTVGTPGTTIMLTTTTDTAVATNAYVDGLGAWMGTEVY